MRHRLVVADLDNERLGHRRSRSGQETPLPHLRHHRRCRTAAGIQATASRVPRRLERRLDASGFRTARQRHDFLGIVKRLPWILATIRHLNRMLGRERGYIYFQDFIADNQFDTRVTIIGNRAFAYTRNVRPGDFRASGSGDIVYDVHRIHPQCVPIAFEVTQKVRSQSMAFDFVLAANQQPMLVEVSYCYIPELVYQCIGHWDDQLKWHQGHMWPQDAILIDLLEDVGRHKSPSAQPGTTAQTTGAYSQLLKS